MHGKIAERRGPPRASRVYVFKRVRDPHNREQFVRHCQQCLLAGSHFLHSEGPSGNSPPTVCLSWGRRTEGVGGVAECFDASVSSRWHRFSPSSRRPACLHVFAALPRQQGLPLCSPSHCHHHDSTVFWEPASSEPRAKTKNPASCCT